MVARVWPTSTASSNDFPTDNPPRSPPTKASPAPFVSTISSSLTALTACLDFIETVGADNNGWLSTTGKHDDTIPDGIGFWLFGKSLGDGGEILGIGETLCARPSLGLGLVTNNIINIGKDLLKLGTEKLRNEGSREVEDENLGK